MFKQVLHLQKPKATPVITSIGEENDRETQEQIAKQMEKNSNIDPRMTQFNKDLISGIDHSLTLYERMQKRIAEGYTSKRKIRTDAVKIIDGVYGAGAEFFKGMTLERKYQFGKDFAEFLVQKVGKENIIGCRIHVDEKAGKDEQGKDLYGVHIHFQFVPLKDGKLDRRSFGLSRYGLQYWHTECAEFMRKKGWDLERGEVRQDWQEPVKHEEPNEYKRKRFTDKSNSMKLDKWIRNLTGRVDVSSGLLGFGEETAKMSSKDYETLLEIAKMGVKLKYEAENRKPLENEIESLRKRYAEKVKSVNDERKALERERAEVANKNEQSKYKRLNADLREQVAQVKADKKEITDRLQQIKANQKDAEEIADALLDKALQGGKVDRDHWEQLCIDNALVVLKKENPKQYQALVEIGRKVAVKDMHERQKKKSQQKQKTKGMTIT
jgi:hypothetical protein